MSHKTSTRKTLIRIHYAKIHVWSMQKPHITDVVLNGKLKKIRIQYAKIHAWSMQKPHITDVVLNGQLKKYSVHIKQ
jgi:hypothetical protein